MLFPPLVSRGVSDLSLSRRAGSVPAAARAVPAAVRAVPALCSARLGPQGARGSGSAGPGSAETPSVRGPAPGKGTGSGTGSWGPECAGPGSGAVT